MCSIRSRSPRTTSADLRLQPRWAARRCSFRLSAGTGAGKPDFVATREYFPQSWRAAARRQRTRWVTGITLQGWVERFGWRGSLSRNLLAVARSQGTCSGARSAWPGERRLLIRTGHGPYVDARDAAQQGTVHRPRCRYRFQLWRLGLRMYFVSRVYGLAYSLGVPIRVFYANFLNAAATFGALLSIRIGEAQGRRCGGLRRSTRIRIARRFWRISGGWAKFWSLRGR